MGGAEVFAGEDEIGFDGEALLEHFDGVVEVVALEGAEGFLVLVARDAVGVVGSFFWHGEGRIQQPVRPGQWSWCVGDVRLVCFCWCWGMGVGILRGVEEIE